MNIEKVAKACPIMGIFSIFIISVAIIFGITAPIFAEEIIQVTYDTTDQLGQHLEGGYIRHEVGGTPFASPAIFTVANGANSSLIGEWGGVYSARPASSITVFKDTTYWIDALTANVRTESTPGVNKVNIVFEQSPAEVATNTQNIITNEITSVTTFQSGEQNSLTTKLDVTKDKIAEATRIYEAGNINKAISLLNTAQKTLSAFINEAQAKINSGQITQDVGAGIIASANELIGYIEELKSARLG